MSVGRRSRAEKGAVRFLVTGIHGFAGAHLADWLLQCGHEVCGFGRRVELTECLQRLASRYPQFGVSSVAVGDVCDGGAVKEAVRRFAPDGVFHLAGQSSVGTGEEDVVATLITNIVGTAQVVRAARARSGSCRVIVVSSGDCYGRSANEKPIPEDTPLRPVSVYAASKAAAEVIARQAVDGYGADVVCVRSFNHTGPGQSDRFVCANFARQIAEVRLGRRQRIEVGNLDVVRDFLDVRDVVRAYVLVWERGALGEVYNIASCVGRRIGEILEEFQNRAGVSAPVEVRAQRIRGAEIPVLVGDNRRLRGLGWKPGYPWEQTVVDVLRDWSRRLRG